MKARFTNVRWEASTIRFNAELGDLQKDLWIELPSGTAKPNDDLIAGVFATLAGPGLESLTMSLSVSEGIIEAIERYAGCPVTVDARRGRVDWITGFDGHAVSFSGGFDSLAARALLPGEPLLISMDFGGWFQRETDFFVEFEPEVVRSNFRMEGFGRRSWMFMLAGCLLLKDEYKLGRYTTGSILESSPWNYKRNIAHAFEAAPLLKDFGFEQVNTTIGITEVSTTLLSMIHFPEYIARSLKSLAAPGTGKSLRKHILVDVLRKEGKAPLDFDLSVQYPENPPLRWGESMTDDMLTPYVIKHAGMEVASRLMSDIPAEVIALCKELSLEFYERYHTGLYVGVDAHTAKHLRDTFADAGIEPFVERDWTEYRRVTEIMAQYHSIPIDS